MKEVIILTKFAEDMIKKGNYEKAKAALIKSIKFDSSSPETYTILGDTFYLLKKQEDAIKCYLSSIHLQINKFLSMNTATLSSFLNTKYNNLSKEAKELLPCKEGMIIFEDSKVPSHIAHAYIDLKNETTDPVLKECENIYIKHLETRDPISIIMPQYNICYEDYIEFDNSHYISLGRELLVDNIKWESINSKGVKTLYFN